MLRLLFTVSASHDTLVSPIHTLPQAYACIAFPTTTSQRCPKRGSCQLRSLLGVRRPNIEWQGNHSKAAASLRELRAADEDVPQALAHHTSLALVSETENDSQPWRAYLIVDDAVCDYSSRSREVETLPLSGRWRAVKKTRDTACHGGQKRHHLALHSRTSTALFRMQAQLAGRDAIDVH
jgi:hypothetical protein